MVENRTAVVDCIICQYIVHELENILKNNKSEEAVKEALEEICTIVPKSIQQQCTSLISTYSEYIVQLILDLGDPHKVCQLLKLCV
jgi:saposin